ncbi:hypothetical protein HYH02_009582 [Chlamydomonas schloesseri]|uniref:F-box domain-containing protein n=1 Tax=Chlamydomonas schloesseri TaxID=2026947 RepID=A0A835W8U9_9CHLO|nr:hypothetical protein HYH02_009582 [Chlamydomonas schloesseri]|eukprot:KAG2442093.1 hypothetical protein HYH02_009582 [Chlamydomonas schloesseri]
MALHSTPQHILHAGFGSHAGSYGSSPGGSLPPFSPPASVLGGYASPVPPNLLGASPAAGDGRSPLIAGASPPYRGGSSAAGDKANPYLAAKKFWKRLCFDPALDPTEYTIGFVETVQQPERKSGVEAWSMRLHDRLMELPYTAFVERFCGTGSLDGPGGGGGAGGGGGGGGEGSRGGGHSASHRCPRGASPSGASGGGGAGGGSLSVYVAAASTSDESSSDVPYHRIAYFKHGNVVVWESEYHKRRLSDLLPPAPPGPPAPLHIHVPSDGGANSHGGASVDRARRRSSRDGMPPLPQPPSPAAFAGFHPGPSARISASIGGASGSYSASAMAAAARVLGASPGAAGGSMGLQGTSLGAGGGGGGLGVGVGPGPASRGRSPHGVSPSPKGRSYRGSDDGEPEGDGDSASDDGDDELLLEEEEEARERARRGGREGEGEGEGGDSTEAEGGGRSSGGERPRRSRSSRLERGGTPTPVVGSVGASRLPLPVPVTAWPTTGPAEQGALLGAGGLRSGAGGAAGGGSAFAAAAGLVPAAEEAPPVPQLPEECWMGMLQQLGVREVCMVGRTCKWLRALASDPVVWRCQYESLWGRSPEPGLGPAVVRRMCRRSQLRAARWVEARVQAASMGFPSTLCVQMDDTKVVSGDGGAVRLWSHATGRRIATLQGHPGRVTSVAFDEQLLVSGCTGSVVKLWSMDELKCKRTARHEGPVTSVCLLPTGIPVSGAKDGLMRLWDVASGAAIVGLEAGGPVAALQAHGPSGRLVAAAGWGVQLWDVSTATLLQTLGLGDDAPAAAAAGGAAPPSPHPYTCVSYVGELLAAGRQGEVVLLDPRVSAPVGRIHCGGPAVPRGGSGGAGAADGGASAAGLPATAGSGRVSLPGALSGVLDGARGVADAGVLGLGGAFASGMGAIAAAAAAAGAGSAGVGGGGRGAPCVGVQMDEWKLVCGFDDGRHQLHLYDIRSLSGATGGGGGASSGSGGGAASAGYGGAISFRRRPWSVPMMTFTAPARISTFQFHDNALIAGCEGAECTMWRFENPNAAPSSAVAVGYGAGAGGGAPGGGGGGGSIAAAAGGRGGGGGGAQGGAGDDDDNAGGGRKKKPGKVPKIKGRYPKRSTK